MARNTVAIAEIEEAAKALEAAREQTVQSRARQEGTYYGTTGFLLHLAHSGELISPWWSRQRDVDLGNVWKESDHVSGAKALLTDKVINVPFRVMPRDTEIKTHMRQADEYNRILVEESEFGQGWGIAASKWLEDYWFQDNGAYFEITGDGDKNKPIIGPATGIEHMDSQRCHRTGNVEYPVVWQDTSGELHRMHRTRVAFAADQPSARVEMRGVGFSVMSRAINNAQTLTDILVYNQEKMGSRPKRGIILGKGIRTEHIVSSLTIADQGMDDQGLRRFAKFPIIGDLPLDSVIEILDLASLPDNFDYETWVRLGMFALALAFGVPIRWIWPAATSGATKADAQFQHIAGLGGGVGRTLKTLTLMLGGDPRGARHTIGKFLPPHLKLVFDFQDDEQDKMKAEVSERRAKTRQVNLDSGVTNTRVEREKALADGDITSQQFVSLELDDGRLEDGTDVLTLFHSVNPFYLRYLDLGVEDPLDAGANDAATMVNEADAAALELNDLIANTGNPSQRKNARLAIAERRVAEIIESTRGSP